MPFGGCRRKNEDQSIQRRGGFRPISWLIQGVLAYALLVFAGGTAIQTGHPVAVEAGKLAHTVLLVEPAIHWTESTGVPVVSTGLRLLQHGLAI